jgi:light-regulated signal transduction histidine kinase (bacteriophytochrome)
MTIPGSSLGATVDLTNCDREPIHLLGAIQPFGFLLAVSTPGWFVQRVSSNVADWLKVAPAEMLGRSLLNFIDAEAIHTLRNQLHIVNMTARLPGCSAFTSTTHPAASTWPCTPWRAWW